MLSLKYRIGLHAIIIKQKGNTLSCNETNSILLKFYFNTVHSTSENGSDLHIATIVIITITTIIIITIIIIIIIIKKKKIYIEPCH